MNIEKSFPVPSGQEFTLERFRPENAPGIANLFFTVFGPDYPVDLYNDPERIIEANQTGDIHSVVCRTPSGDVIAAGSLYRSASPNPNLLELGMYMVLVPYRKSSAAYWMTKFLCETLAPELGIDGFYGESVTNHVATQKMMRLVSARTTGVELMLMPAAIYAVEKSAPGRVTCIAGFRIDRDKPQKIFVPECYQPLLANIASRMNLQHEIVSDRSHPVPDAPSCIAFRCFDSAGVMRITLRGVGQDISQQMDELEAEADKRGLVVRQWFLNLNDGAIEEALAFLRSTGYFFSSYMPRWFGGDAGGDGLLMQKILEEPDYAAIRIYDEESAEIMDFIREDQKRVQDERKK